MRIRFLLLVFALVAPWAGAQEDLTPELLSRPVIVPAYITDGMHVAAISVLAEAHVPAGLVIKMAPCDAEVKRQFKFDSKTLKGALDTLVTADAQYEWEQADGVINIMRRVRVSLLDARIPSLDVTNEPSAELVFEKITRSPEVRRKAAQWGLTAQKFNRGPGVYVIRRPGTGPEEAPRLINIHRKDLTLRQALNALVAAKGQGYWELTLRPCANQTIYEFSHGQ